jgi:hypothetical protein
MNQITNQTLMLSSKKNSYKVSSSVFVSSILSKYTTFIKRVLFVILTRMSFPKNSRENSFEKKITSTVCFDVLTVASMEWLAVFGL